MAKKKDIEELKQEVLAEAEVLLNPAGKTLELARLALEKQFGKGIVHQGQDKIIGVSAISSGCMSIDTALGVGGYPRGRIIEIGGPESSGKTTLCLHAVAEAQKLGLGAAYVDMEHALDLKYAKDLGVDTDLLLISQPDSAEEGLEVVEKIIATGAVGICVVDSVAALTPKAELEGVMGQQFMGLQARLMSQAMRKLTGIVYKTNTVLIFVNQIRMKIGVVYGNPETSCGGNALKFYASQRLDVRRKEVIKEGETSVANLTKVKVSKNKVAPPFREAEFLIRYGSGIDAMADLVKVAVDKNIIDKAGAWYAYDNNKLGQGEANVCAFLKGNPKLVEEITNKVRA